MPKEIKAVYFLLGACTIVGSVNFMHLAPDPTGADLSLNTHNPYDPLIILIQNQEEIL